MHKQSSVWEFVFETCTWAGNKINLYNLQSYYNLIVVEQSTLSSSTTWLFHITVALHHLLFYTSLIILLHNCYLCSLTVIPRKQGKYYGLNSHLDSNKLLRVVSLNSNICDFGDPWNKTALDSGSSRRNKVGLEGRIFIPTKLPLKPSRCGGNLLNWFCSPSWNNFGTHFWRAI